MSVLKKGRYYWTTRGWDTNVNKAICYPTKEAVKIANNCGYKAVEISKALNMVRV